MNFSGVSLHSPEIGVCQPKVYGNIQSHHNMSSTLHILSAGKYKHHMKARWDTARKEWKIDNVEIKIITSVLKLGVKSIVVLYNEGNLLGH